HRLKTFITPCGDVLVHGNVQSHFGNCPNCLQPPSSETVIPTNRNPFKGVWVQFCDPCKTCWEVAGGWPTDSRDTPESKGTRRVNIGGLHRYFFGGMAWMADG